MLVLFMGAGCSTPVKWAPVEYKTETIDCNYKQVVISYSTEKERNALIQFVENTH